MIKKTAFILLFVLFLIIGAICINLKSPTSTNEVGSSISFPIESIIVTNGMSGDSRVVKDNDMIAKAHRILENSTFLKNDSHETIEGYKLMIKIDGINESIIIYSKDLVSYNGGTYRFRNESGYQELKKLVE